MTRYYISGNYEIDSRERGWIQQKLYLCGDYYSAPAVYVKEDTGSWQLYYICRDYLGSITHITSSSGSVVEELSYDAWGRLRNPSDQTVFTTDTEPSLFLGRGYTGHEHLPMFGLVNMNARLYDPAVGRFLAPDPYVQAPENSQNFNRYTYCLNNPFRYTDPDGEIFGTLFGAIKDFFVNTFVKSWTQGINAWTKTENWHTTRMGWEIDKGLFQGDFKQIASRFTWELPQTILGYSAGVIHNAFGGVKDVTYYGGATAVESYSENWGAFTLGSYIIGHNGLQADPNNSLFQHEYGHYLQSQAWGLAYLSRGALPSLFDTFGRKGDHKFHQIEQDANMRAFKYFNKNVEGFYQSEADWRNYSGNGWNFKSNSLDIFGNGYEGYVDYRNTDQMALVNALKVNPSALDYITGSLFFANPLPMLMYGFRNHVHYNKYKYTIY